MQLHGESGLSRLSERRLRALAYANEVRLGRAQLKRDLTARTRTLDAVLVEPPACAQTAEVRELLLAVPGMRQAKADRLLGRCRIGHARTLADLSGRQQAELIELLRR